MTLPPRRRPRAAFAAAGAVGLVVAGLMVVALVPSGTGLQATDSLAASPDPEVTATATPNAEPTDEPTASPTAVAAATASPDPAASTAGRPSDAELVALTPGCTTATPCRVVGRVDLAVGAVAAVGPSDPRAEGRIRYVLVRGDRLIDTLPKGTAWALEYPSQLAADPEAPRNVLALVSGGATAWWVHAFRPTTTSLGLLSGSIDEPDYYGDGGTGLLDAGGFEVGAHRKVDPPEGRVIRYGWNGSHYARATCEHQSAGDGKDEYPC